MNFEHLSVLLNECIEGLNIKSGGIYVDGTLGGAGHSFEICKKLNNSGSLIGIDQDENAILASKKRLKDFTNVTFVRNNFSNIKNIADAIGLYSTGVDGFLLDLGVSSHQLDEEERGFSYMKNARLDMRMDTRNTFSAYELVNTYTQEELNKIISKYGEERWAKRIANFIVEARKEKPIETTFDLVSIIKKAIPKSARIDGPHPAKRTFQAIRIEVNNELEILERTIFNIVELLNKGGRLCIITFHSLEDRLVKQAFKNLAFPCSCPREFPVCVCGQKTQIKIITRKPILPSDEELEINHRARSAKLRILEKI